jgi:integrase
MAKKDQGSSDSYIPLNKNLDSNVIRTLLDNIPNKRDYLLIKILYEVGCTVSELVDIKVEDIKANSICVGRQRRKVEISSELSEEIKSYLKGGAPSGFLFSTRQSPKLDVRRVQQVVKSYLRTKPSELRHLRIVELSKIKDPEEIKKSVGLSRLEEKYFLKNDEIKKLHESIIDAKHSLMFNLLLETGCHISELVELKVEDINENTVFVGSPKRNVVISDRLASDIKDFVSEGCIKGALFTTRQSYRISDKRIFQILSEYGKASGIKLNPRILRNTRLASMLQSGEDRSKIELELGIKRIEFGSYGLLKKNE